jgi:hypothetical protein
MAMSNVVKLPPPKPRRLEVHAHTFVSGPRANGMFIQATQKTTSEFNHSHEGGEIPHDHPDTGPSCYTIDKDQWAAMTGGLLGGGRKKFTPEPTGEQMPMRARTPEENTFEIHYCDPPADWNPKFSGGGFYAAARMVQAFRMRPVVIDHRGPGAKAKQ